MNKSERCAKGEKNQDGAKWKQWLIMLGRLQQDKDYLPNENAEK